MMADFSSHAEEHTLRAWFNGTSPTVPDAWQLSIHTADPGEDGEDSEVPDTDRQPISFAAPTDEDNGHEVASDVQVEFEDMPAVETTHGFIWGRVDTDPDVWEPLGRAELGTPRTTTAGDTLRFAAGAVTFALD
jgi:hypothetical protein